jgi:hypothetical protein
MSKNKNLLNENTIRRMMKLASVDSLSDSFISTKYTPLAESVEEETVEERQKYGGNKGDKSKTHKGDKDYTAKKEEPGEDKRKGAEKRGAEGTLAKTKGHGKVDYANEELIHEDEEEEKELGATEDELSDMDSEADRERDELEADDEAMEDEVSLTDDEARDIIALADKLRAAMGGGEEAEVEMSMDMDADGEEMEMDAEVEEEPGMRHGMMEEEEENLYEAALSNLDIEVIEEKEVQLENLKKEIYKKVVNRLLKESKK